jgi:microcystin-dependent protein
MPTAIDNMQPGLVLNQVIALAGVYPYPDGGSGQLDGMIGQIHTFATNHFADSFAGQVANLNGGLLTIDTHQALFSLLGTTYGGDGDIYFALPDLGDRVSVFSGQGPGLTHHDLGTLFGANAFSFQTGQMPLSVGGAAQSFSNEQASATVGWYINTEGIFPSLGGSNVSSQMIGMVGAFAGNFAPYGTIPCDGRLLLIADYDVLFNVIGTTYGGDGEVTFAVPDLRGRSIIGAGGGYEVGQVVGTATGSVTSATLPTDVGGGDQPMDNHGPGLVLTALIATQGIFGGFTQGSPGLGEVLFFAGNYAPGGALAQGQLLPINQNQALFSLHGMQFGGNGQTTFALPDLRGRVVVGDGNGHVLGEVLGSPVIDLTLANLPELTITGDSGADILGGGHSADRLTGMSGADTLNGRGGNDILNGGADADTLNGGGGQDTAAYGGATSTVRIDLLLIGPQNTGGAGWDTLNSIEHLNGSGYNDTLLGASTDNILRGQAGNDILDGRGGKDRLEGGIGDDRLFGGAGNDVLSGGVGRDTLAGGADADRFVFDDGDFSSPIADRIVDFSHAEGDRIQLNLVDANTSNGAADDVFSFIGTGTFTSVAGQLRYQQHLAGPGTADDATVIQGDTDGDGTADFAIRLDGLHTLVAGDFVL